jgi:enediyne biosynthesis protein E4
MRSRNSLSVISGPGSWSGRFLAIFWLAVLGVIALAGCRQGGTASRQAAAVRPRFTDITRSAGVDWRHVNGASGRLLYPELVGGGGGLVDVNGDGWLDLLLINSGALPGFKGKPGRHALYLNNGDGTFRDATAAAGLDGPSYGMGVAAGDYDDDGQVDLYITGVHEGRLYRNMGAGRFVDATTPAVRNAGRWGTSASWADVNSDGLLDLFIGNYVRWSAERDVPCSMRGLRTYCGPTSYDPDHCLLLINRGGGRFTDGTVEAGLKEVPAKALGVVMLDVDHNRQPDFLVACDLKPNLLLRNRGRGSFEEIAVERGVALSEAGLARAGMGIDAREEEPGQWSVWIGNLTQEGMGYYRQSPDGSFTDVAPAEGLHTATFHVLTFGLTAQDFDLDGRVDLALANGHVDLLAERTRDEPVLQPPLLFQRQPDGRATDVTASAGEPFRRRYLARGLAAGDIDNDGDADLLLVENNGPAHLWRNDTDSSHHWLGLDCRLNEKGTPAVGTRVEVSAGGRTQVRWVRGDGSYLSANDFRVVFGLGAASTVGSVRIRWPDGRLEEHRTLDTGRYWRLVPGRTPAPQETPLP